MWGVSVSRIVLSVLFVVFFLVVGGGGKCKQKGLGARISVYRQEMKIKRPKVAALIRSNRLTFPKNVAPLKLEVDKKRNAFGHPIIFKDESHYKQFEQMRG